MRVAPKIILSDQDRAILEKWARGRSTPARLVQRAQIILRAAAGKRNDQIGNERSLSRQMVGLWRERFVALGLAGLAKDAPRGGRKATKRQALVPTILEWTTQKKPGHATHWSCRTLAKALGTNATMISRVWAANGLKPHRSRTFKVSTDPQFAAKLTDVVGLYLNPPEHALVLSVDEKSQIQALDRTQPTLPLKKWRCGTRTHDYVRHGTTTLFAALEMAQGKLIGCCMSRHRHQEWIKFLGQIDRQTPADLDLHLIVDNYATHKHPQVKAWLQRHPRFHLHFTPTSSSWANMVQRWFREITDKRIRRGAFGSVEQLIAAIDDFIAQHNQNPKTFIWTAKVEDILAKVRRARDVLNKTASE